MAKTARFLPTYCELLTLKRKLSESIASGTVLVRILWRWEYFECFCRAPLKSLFVSHPPALLRYIKDRTYGTNQRNLKFV